MRAHSLSSLLPQGFLQAFLRSAGRLGVLFVKESEYLPDVYAGVEVSTDGLCRRLRRWFHRVAVVAVCNSRACDASGALAENVDAGVYEWNDYDVYVAPQLINALERALVEKVPDVVILQEFGLNSWKAIKGRLRGVPLLFYHHSLLPALDEFFQDKALGSREHTAFLSCSPSIREYMMRQGVESKVIPPLFGIERYRRGQRSGENIVMVSIQVNKGADIALEIARQRPQHSFVFVKSWTNSIDETARLISDIQQLPNATVMPSVPDMRGIFACSKLLLMPSRYEEGWGRVATEAQLFGIPVLGSNRGRLRDTIGAGGVTLDPNADIEVWLKAFDWILEEPGTFEKLASAAKAHGRQTLKRVAAAEHDLVAAMYSVLKEPSMFARWRSQRLMMRENRR
jgi:glycosyltransferase involved in cell wall biosynthesis